MPPDDWSAKQVRKNILAILNTRFLHYCHSGEGGNEAEEIERTRQKKSRAAMNNPFRLFAETTFVFLLSHDQSNISERHVIDQTMDTEVAPEIRTVG
ncbi:hypothetical protein [Noviherbaspirillum saxi]|uniref:Uncharacterized protein n=1 Tax=Noviherbaspirillum saxi TaxID=2320863 RepID=A0A3A3FK40_9BURK|nr:hypothetical protein [Noviherbaspirillum saxi]RJF95888.1 hypothetical protein D3871_21245 [Noviherbaspirillum saxi]